MKDKKTALLKETNVSIDLNAKNKEEHKYGLIVTTHPTQNDIDRAKEQLKMVFVFMAQPEGVTDHTSSGIWIDGYLKGCGIKTSDYIGVVFIPEKKDIEKEIEKFKERWGESHNPSKHFNLSLYPLKGSNIFFSDIKF